MKMNNEKMMNSMNKAMIKVNTTSDLKSFMNLDRGDFELEYKGFTKCYVGKMEAAKGL